MADGSRCVVIVILEKGVIPPNALFEKINPDIDVDFYHTEVRRQKTGRSKTLANVQSRSQPNASRGPRLGYAGCLLTRSASGVPIRTSSLMMHITT